MKGLLLITAALVAALSLGVGLSSALAASHSGVNVGVASSGLGNVLVDGRGHTLYLFEQDKQGKSACSGKCASLWPPLIASGKPLAAGGAKASLLGTVKRADGRLQVTYGHHPLYTFVKDTKKGQTNGEGFGDQWYAVSAAGNKVTQDNASSGGGAGSAPGGGYGSGY
jgi:predicted lipoprotein with Yx(FWY)xxD motif